MISAGGYKVWPRDVEDVLYEHPAVREAAVVGVPDEYRGETVKAYVSLKPGQNADAGELVAFAKERTGRLQGTPRGRDPRRAAQDGDRQAAAPRAAHARAGLRSTRRSRGMDTCRGSVACGYPERMRMRRRRAVFADRVEAGARLGANLRVRRWCDPVVLGLARGGVPVAAGVATALDAPLDVAVARKIGAPAQPEWGLGAVTADGLVNWDPASLRRARVAVADLAEAVAREKEEAGRQLRRYREVAAAVPVADRDVVLVDDGLATGVTARAAPRRLRDDGPRSLVLAVPVGRAGTARPPPGGRGRRRRRDPHRTDRAGRRELLVPGLRPDPRRRGARRPGCRTAS